MEMVALMPKKALRWVSTLILIRGKIVQRRILQRILMVMAVGMMRIMMTMAMELQIQMTAAHWVILDGDPGA